MSERCELWDLPVEQCACPKHRGMRKEPAGVVIPVHGAVIEARYPGRCKECREEIEVGEPIRSVVAVGGWAHARCADE